MATREQIDKVAAALDMAPPKALAKMIDKQQAGIGAVLHFLSESEGPTTASKIAEQMNVSTARITVLLKKMEAKGLIVKAADPEDARVKVVRLSAEGESAADALSTRIRGYIGQVIDRVGVERLLDFAEVMEMFNQVFFQSPLDEW